MCECGREKKKEQHTRGRTEEGEKHTRRQTSNAATQTKTHGSQKKNGPRIEKRGERTPQESSKKTKQVASTRSRQKTQNDNKAAKHKTTGRNQESSGRKEKVCVCVSTCYLIFDLLNPANLKIERERKRGQDKRTFMGQGLKGQKDKHNSYSRETSTETNHQQQNSSTNMIAIQDSEDDTRGGRAHGPPLAFRESFWGTVAPRVPKHPPLREPPPKSICPTPKQSRPGTLKEKIPTLSRLLIHLIRLATTRQTNSRHHISLTPRHAPNIEHITQYIQHTIESSEPFPGGTTWRWSGTPPQSFQGSRSSELNPFFANRTSGG